ncbi:glycosyltransferase family 9 protein [Syntrophobacter fumaroxidans]|uniref:Glycosyl transferase, family 9 n=1 Tax=Syntrophobacter fumaroxidans (strain DSM 10017 / MPOB) TaxID=335543 RepID=A0LF70_SYNFM|nr:glycosyltransferase family 9 protein [Syntrophobacter fumaroxidans]ABK16072.1 glycosyl transferase, family 9 [Syntrophobacter fumaroxidans MPOB]
MRLFHPTFKWIIRKISGRMPPPLDLETFRPDAVNSILIVSSTAIGDALMSTPAIRSVRTSYPEANIVLLARHRYRELFENNRHVDKIVSYHGGYKKFLQTVRLLRKEAFDLAVILHGNTPQAVPLAYLTGARHLVTLPVEREFAYLISNRNGDHSSRLPQHTIRQRLGIAQLAGGAGTSVDMELEVTGEARRQVDAWLHGAVDIPDPLLVGFQAGASKPYKQWPVKSFAELGKRILASHPRARIFAIGSPKEKALCAEVVRAIGSDRAVSVAGRFPLTQVAALIGRLELLVTNDTGAMHIAIALKTKTVSLFCPTSSRVSGAIQDPVLHRAIEKDLPCRPCIGKKCTTPFCMEQITVEEVFRAFREFEC